MQLVTQTGPEGQKVRNLLIEEGADIKHEYYVAVLTDRATVPIAVMASSERQHGRPEVAHSTRKILKEFVDPLVGLTDAQAENLAGISVPGLPSPCSRYAQAPVPPTWKADASLAEISPLISKARQRQGPGRQVQLRLQRPLPSRKSSKSATLDERGRRQIEPQVRPRHISLDGNIGCLVDWCRSAMATMDTIKLFGAEPGQLPRRRWRRRHRKVTESLPDHAQEPRSGHPRQYLPGGIMRCDTIAAGVVAAARK